MCGLAGILRLTEPGEPGRAMARCPAEAAIPEAWLDALDARIRHRGPDGTGRFRDRVIGRDGRVADVALVHRRMSVIDHACGQQPMVIRATGRSDGPNADARLEAPVAVAFNGCIHNHRAVRAALSAGGERFQTDHSDTEVIPRAYLAQGFAGLDELEGPMAFALWDGTRGHLLLTRDAFGEKPLYVCVTQAGEGRGDERTPAGRLVVFASNAAGVAEALHLVTDQASPVEVRALGRWLGWGYDAEATPWRGIKSVPAATTLQFSGLGAAGEAVAIPLRTPIRRAGRRALRPGANIASEVEGLLREAVGRRLEADVPVTSFLSGGVDSSLVTLLACRARPSLTAFNVTMPDPRMDESAHAAAAARAIGCRVQTVRVSPNAGEDLVDLISTLGLPFGDSSLLPTHWVSRAAREAGFGVALTGDGGDELFLGYDRYAAAAMLAPARQRALAPTVLLAIKLGLLPAGTTGRRGQRLRRLAEAIAQNAYAEVLALFAPDLRRQLLGAAGEAGNRPASPEFARDIASAADARDWELFTHLPGDYLRKVDAGAMAVPLETRAPMLDRALAAVALGLPAKEVLRGGRKGLLREIARRHLPGALVDRPKQGFAVPIGDWFRSDFGGLRRLLLDRLVEPGGLAAVTRLGVPLDAGVVRRLVEDHLGTGRSGIIRGDHAQRLYALLVLSIWAEGAAPAA